MHKIIHETFEFDLTPYGVSTVEENYWFSDKFYTKYSFPFTFHLNAELKKVFNALLDDNAKFTEKTYNVKYVSGNQLENAILEIESQIGEQIEATYRFGIEEFPNWDKKLATFDFPEFNPSDIYAHAKSLLDPLIATPILRYEFPFVHTDKYDTEELTWSTFLGSFNNYDKVNEAFYENTNASEDFANRNIMQPALYFSYIVNFCFEAGGFTTSGTLFNDTIFKQLLLFASVDYFKRNKAAVIPVLITYADLISNVNNVVNYNSQYILESNKTYQVTGKIYLSKLQGQIATARAEYNGVSVYYVSSTTKGFSYFRNFNFTFSTIDDENINHYLNFLARENETSLTASKEYVFDLEIKEIVDGSTEVPDEIENENSINLKKALPDVTFGDFFTEVRKAFNVDRRIVGKEIILDKIEDKINYNNAVDLSDYEVLKPKKETNKRDSFLIKNKFNDDECVFLNRETVAITGDLVNDDTEELELNLRILQPLVKNGVFTSFLPAEASASDLCVVVYSNANAKLSGYNITQPTDDLTAFSLYEAYYFNFYNFLLNSLTYKWVFKMYQEKLSKINTKVFAYGRFHIVKSLDKTQIDEDLFEVEIETETLP